MDCRCEAWVGKAYGAVVIVAKTAVLVRGRDRLLNATGTGAHPRGEAASGAHARHAANYQPREGGGGHAHVAAADGTVFCLGLAVILRRNRGLAFRRLRLFALVAGEKEEKEEGKEGNRFFHN